MDQNISLSQSSSIHKEIKRNDLLKIIAMLTMLIDHIGVMLFPDVDFLRTIGRIAFPIFAYFIAIGYHYTSSRAKYLLRLLLFGAIAQIPYMYLNYEFSPEKFHFNVILFFAYSFLMLFLYDASVKAFRNRSWALMLVTFIGLLFTMALPEILVIKFSDFAFSYGSYGLLMILLFYIFKNKVAYLIIGYILLSFFGTYLSGVRYLYLYAVPGAQMSYLKSFSSFDMVWTNITTYKDGLRLLDGYFLQARSIMGLMVIIICQRFQLTIHMHRYFAYAFYPVHIILLIFLRVLLKGPIQ